MVTPRLRLGQLLVDARMISQEVLDEVLVMQRADGRRLGTLLVEQGLINETQLTQILSHQLAVPWVSLLHIEFSRQLLNLVPHDVAERFCLVPIYVRHVRNQGETLYVAMDDPTNEDGLKECTTFSGLPVRAMIAPPSDIRNAIRVYYGARVHSVAPPVADPPRAPATDPPLTPATDTEPRLPHLSGVDAEALAEATLEALVEPSVPLAAAWPATDASELRRDEDDLQPMLVVDGQAEDEDDEEARRPTLVVAPPEELIAESQPEHSMMIAPPPDAAFLAADPGVADLGGEEGVPAPAAAVPAAAASLLEAVLGQTAVTQDDPASEQEVKNIPQPPRRARRMVSLTLLDGTTITLPARGARAAKPASDESAPHRLEPPPAEDAGLTARDLVSALRAVSHGADASEILGNNVRWEAMFAALLSLLLKKHLIADWEFVDELKKF